MESSVDSSYGWVVCVASLFVNMVTDGILFSYGLYYLELRDYFQCSDSLTALASSLMCGLSLISGPFVSVLVNLYGCRVVTMLGGFTSAAGLICSSFATSIYMLAFFYGVIGGIGMSMLYIPSVMVVILYFEQRRALANGVAMCGSGVGIVVFSFLLTWLIRELTWHSVIQLLAGFLMQCVVCGALYRPINASDSVRSAPSMTLDLHNTNCAHGSSNHISPDRTESYETLHPHIPKLTAASESDDNSEELKYDVRGKSSSTSNRDKRESLRTSLLKRETTALHEQQIARSVPNLNLTVNLLKHPLLHASHSLLHPLERKDIFYSGSLSRIPHNSEPPSAASSTNTLHAGTRGKTSTCPLLIQLKYLIDCSLMKNRSFLAIILSCTLWTGQGVVLTFMAPLAVSGGTPLSKVSWLYCCIGLSNIVGRIVCGWITDHPVVNSVRLYSVALLFAGVASMVFPFVTSFAAHVTCCTMFGLCMAFYVSLRSIILVDVLGIDRLTNSFGLLVTFQGFGFFAAPPIAGLLLDITSSFITPFVLTGVCFMLAGIVCLPLKTLPVIPKELSPPRAIGVARDNIC